MVWFTPWDAFWQHMQIASCDTLPKHLIGSIASNYAILREDEHSSLVLSML
ncbi:hypothetical protein QDX12_25810 (plasmid) [Escherichia coli]|nr:hypothetical protein QDX12_25810 [Escherichia coli]